jgi:hypothetical protein
MWVHKKEKEYIYKWKRNILAKLVHMQRKTKDIDYYKMKLNIEIMFAIKAN